MRLSGVVQEIADVIGRDRALYLIGKLPRCYAGVEGKQSWRVIMYVPTLQKLTPKHQLVSILGWHDAVKLCNFFGGEILQPGNCSELYKPFRDKAILRLSKSGLDAKTLAEWFGVSERHIRSVKAANPQEAITPANDNNLRIHKRTAQNERSRQRHSFTAR